MVKKKSERRSQPAGKLIGEEHCSLSQGGMTEHEKAVNAAVEASMQRFVEANQENIRKSSKDRVASASYCGGMVDMITIVRSALGKWAVEQLLAELERWNRTSVEEKMPEVKINVSGIEMSGVSPEDAKELGEQIAKWIQTRKGPGKRYSADPMFA